MASSHLVTPPRWGKPSSVKGEFIPKLTSSFDSGSVSPPSEASGSPSSFTGYTGSTLTTKFAMKNSAKSPPRHPKHPKDESILRGAALIRESYLTDGPGNLNPSDVDENILRGADLVKQSLSNDTQESHRDSLRENKSLFDYSVDDFESDFDDGSGVWSDPRIPAQDFNPRSLETTWKDDFEYSRHSMLDKDKHWSALAILTKDSNVDYTPQPIIDQDVHWSTLAILTKDSDVKPRSPARLGAAPLELNNVQELQARAFPSKESPRSGSPTPSSATDGTHITRMGRGRCLRVKMVEYIVRPVDEFDETTHEGTYDGGDSYDGSFKSIPIREDQRPSPTLTLRPPVSMPLSLSSPLSSTFEKLQRDVGYQHAQNAGYVWQSLAGQHVRFPSEWFEGARSPPLGPMDAKWVYISRHGVNRNPVLNQIVKGRSKPGRLLLHFLVRDLMTGTAVFDLVIGAFHPNARGIRTSAQPNPREENARHVWMGIRKRTDVVSLLDSVLCRGKPLDEVARESPLGGDRRSVSNLNMRAVFGEEPPIHTICIQESELFEKLSAAAELDPTLAKTPALLILKEFLMLA